jgi:hypothetical protein
VSNPENSHVSYESQAEPRGESPPGPAPGDAGPPPRSWRSREEYREPQYGFDPRSKNAALACFLSLMPGLGQVYLGYYQRGFVHVLIVGTVIAMLAAGAVEPITPLLGLFLAFFWLYNVIDAGRRAGLYNHALRSGGSIELPVEIRGQGAGGAIFGGTALVALGFVLLLYTRFDVSLRWLEEWWPVAPILFGGWLVYQGLAAARKRAAG